MRQSQTAMKKVWVVYCFPHGVFLPKQQTSDIVVSQRTRSLILDINPICKHGESPCWVTTSFIHLTVIAEDGEAT